MLQCALELLSTTQVHKLPSSSRDAMQANLSNRRSLKTFCRPYFWLSREGAKRSAGAMEGDSFLVEIRFSARDAYGSAPLALEAAVCLWHQGQGAHDPVLIGKIDGTRNPEVPTIIIY